MNNPVKSKPSHPDLDGMTDDEIYDYIEFSPEGTISDEVYDIANKIIFWDNSTLLVGYSYGKNIKGGAVPIGKFRQQGKHYRAGSLMLYVGNRQKVGFRIVRNKP